MLSRSASSQNSARNARASDAWLRGSVIRAPSAASPLNVSCTWTSTHNFARVGLRQTGPQPIQVALQVGEVRTDRALRMTGARLTPIEVALVTRIDAHGRNAPLTGSSRIQSGAAHARTFLVPAA